MKKDGVQADILLVIWTCQITGTSKDSQDNVGITGTSKDSQDIVGITRKETNPKTGRADTPGRDNMITRKETTTPGGATLHLKDTVGTRMIKDSGPPRCLGMDSEPNWLNGDSNQRPQDDESYAVMIDLSISSSRPPLLPHLSPGEGGEGEG
ncbi:hypothetical protein ACOMHN_061191 [Nucella lapillus]